MSVDTIELGGGLATKIVGRINLGWSFERLAEAAGITTSEAQRLYVRCAEYKIASLKEELAELTSRMEIIAARA